MEWSAICSECNKKFPVKPDVMVCPICSQRQEPGRPLRGILDVRVEGKVEHPLQVEDFLPVKKKFFPSIPVGNTPLWEPDNLRKNLDFPNLYIKDDTLNPTGSLKDRASFLVAAFALAHNIDEIVVASTGNAASSMAGIGAAAGLNVTIFIPANAPRAKMIQSLQYGARVLLVNGNYDKAYELSLQYTRTRGGLSRNTAFNPLTIEGKKTASIEIFKQLGGAPDFLFLPAGDGVILSGVVKGFRDLKQFGFIRDVPVIVAVQSDGSNAICRAFEHGDFTDPVSAKTIADSIAVDVPRNGYHALKQLRKYSGQCVTVSDEAILESQRMLAASTGLFAEPSAAASLAGFLKIRRSLPHHAVVVLLITGSGLKDIDSASQGVVIPGTAINEVEDIL